MTYFLALCAMSTVFATGATLLALRVVSPRTASLALVLCMVAIASVGIWIVSVPAFAFLLHSSSDGGFAGWCRTLVTHRDIPTWVGLPSALLLAASAGRGARRWRALRAQTQLTPPGDRVTVIESTDAIAVTTPGRSGRIIVSTALMDILTPIERRAVLAHEHTHLDCRHDRYLMAAEIAVAVVPPMGWLNRLLRRSLERWADEGAAQDVGDRSAVGRAIEKAARAATEIPVLASGIGHSDIIVRLDALDHAPVAGPGAWIAGAILVALSATATLTVITGTGIQFHQLAELIMRVCVS